MINYRKYRDEDYLFLRKMLFEAVFWNRPEEDRPSLEEGLSYDYTKHILVDFGNRVGDIAVIAEVDGEKAGAAFIRYWSDEVNIRGYISSEIPVLVIGVVDKYRQKGIGSLLIKALKDRSVKKSIGQISLCVTKTNIAYKLYVKEDFNVYEDIGDSYNMLWKK